jgi:hypothetical protein
MTDHLETDLRTALAQHAAALPPHAGVQLRRIDYRPRSPRRRTVLTLMSALGTAGVAAVVLSVVGLDTGTQRAFAGWTPTPTAPTSGQTPAAEAACSAQLPTSAEIEHSQSTATGSHPDVPLSSVPAIVAGGWHSVLADTRGPFTMTLFEAAKGQAEAACLDGPPSSQSSIGMVYGAEMKAAAPGQIQVSSFGLTRTLEEQPYMRIVGHTGSGVSSVTLVLGDGTHVAASVAHGWFLAWWPGMQQAVDAEVTTAGGRSSQQLGLPGLPSASAARVAGRAERRLPRR